MRILVAGSSGLVGSRLVDHLTARGDGVQRLVRSRDAEGVFWDPAIGDLDDVSGFDGVVHLGGENIANGRWSAAMKRRIHDSRVDSTRLLATRIARANPRPSVFVCASAIGIYGDRGAEPLDERSALGEGFLADVGRAWEAAAQPARDADVRVVNLRLGIVLSPAGGALRKMLTPFKLGLGGRIGSGHQYWSWVSLDDVVEMIAFALDQDTLRGPVNAVAPHAATNRQFTEALGHALDRPTILPLPAFAARLVLGREAADALLLASTRVAPVALQAAGYEFTDPELEPALCRLLAR